ncbi:MAG: hypothetical protein NEA02_17940 [Thermoanaerobaculia bacterium]|nr:hypothetical protein [Thermoanaerobaculia bacterium]
MEPASRDVRPPSATREALGVGAAVAAVILLGGVRIATLPDLGSVGGRTAVTAALTANDQVVYQSLLVAVDSVASLRKKTGRWPDVPALAGEEVPPFAPALLPTAARGLVWSVSANGTAADYAGVDPSGRRTAFLLRVKVPEKGASAEVWFRRGGTASAAGAYPVREGWFELVALDGDTGPRP